LRARNTFGVNEYPATLRYPLPCEARVRAGADKSFALLKNADEH
jgi:hypothetical protein